MAALLLAGCGRTNDVPSGDGQIVRSSENIEQENAENLQDKDEESPDMVKTGTCRLFI